TSRNAIPGGNQFKPACDACVAHPPWSLVVAQCWFARGVKYTSDVPAGEVAVLSIISPLVPPVLVKPECESAGNALAMLKEYRQAPLQPVSDPLTCTPAKSQSVAMVALPAALAPVAACDSVTEVAVETALIVVFAGMSVPVIELPTS